MAAQARKGIVCDLNPQKSRVLLRLALLKPRSLAEIQQLFVEYQETNPLAGRKDEENMRIRMLAAVAALSLGGATAFAQDVNVDFDKSADFSKIKTFSVKIGTSWGNPLGEKRVTDEIEGTLAEKGWTKAEADKADAIVVLHGATEKQKELNTFYSGGGGMYGGYGWRGMGGAGMGMGTAHTTATEYTVGTLVVDIFDAKSKQLLFRGTAQDELSDKPEKNQKKLTKASDKMFKNFPPGSKEKK